jgi:hypothetical protein
MAEIEATIALVLILIAFDRGWICLGDPWRKLWR